MMEASSFEIRESGKSIYDALDSEYDTLWLSNLQLESILNDKLCGMSVKGFALRTRSKVVKKAVCKALGYPVPKSFKKTQPRFPGQNFDTYTQKSNNLQIWNEELDVSRRYVLIRISEDDIIIRVKVVDGATLAKLDQTGTLTQKYQARFITGTETNELVSSHDTDLVKNILGEEVPPLRLPGSLIAPPSSDTFIPIAELSSRLGSLIGVRFEDPGSDQERNRGAYLHRRICLALGYDDYHDNGSFPDITAQLLEVKLQTSPTIDLGLVTPDSTELLNFPAIKGKNLRHCDVRYAVFSGHTDGVNVTLTHLVLVTGEEFFTRFTRFEGKVLNKKLQIPLPQDFFDS